MPTQPAAARIAAVAAQPLTLLRLALRQWLDLVLFGAQVLVVALSPSSYRRAARSALLHQLYLATWAILPWFTLLSALFSLVLIRIVVVTAQSYGLSQYALEMVVRVLVIELVPLTTALMVALRSGLALSVELAAWHRQGQLSDLRNTDAQTLSQVLAPRVLAGMLSVVLLASVTGVVALALAYLGVYGLSPWGFAAYTRMVGHVFSPAVSLGLVAKTLLFGLAVAVVPAASALQLPLRPALLGSAAAVPRGTVRMLLALVLIEAASLVVKYI